MSASSPDDGLWCRRFHPAPDAAARLVCFPHAGGSASFYRPVSAALSPAVDVLSVQYPGRQDRRCEPGIDSVAELADRVFQALLPSADRPLTFFGHSMGAVVAFEVARRFDSAGRTPLRLFASGRRAPSRHRDSDGRTRSDEEILAELRELSGTDARVFGDEEILRMVLPAIRSDYRAVDTYRCPPGASVRCPVSVLVGDGDPETTLDEARAWAGHTTGGFEMRVLPGGHFYLNDRADDVLRLLADHFRQPVAAGGGGF